MTKATTWPCLGCGATLSGRGGRRYCGPDCRPRCAVEGCQKPTHGVLYCSAHHCRWKKYGDPEHPLSRQKNIGPCSVDGCDRPTRKVGLCASHYSQKRARGVVEPFKYEWVSEPQPCLVCGAATPPGSRRRYCSDGCQVAWSRTAGQRPSTSVCDFCGQKFSLGRARTGRLQRSDTKWCPDCGAKSPDVQRFRRYGITREQYEAAVAKGCSICGRTDKKLHVDHDHSCCSGKNMTCHECIRGFICGPCNRGLGLFFDDPVALERAANYLRTAHNKTRGSSPMP